MLITGGSGLGLFISRRLTEMHGGAIGFASKAGVGSTFSFFIKSRRLRAPAQVEKSPARGYGLLVSEAVIRKPPSRKDQPASQQVDSPKGVLAEKDLHILIVEDNLVNQRVLAKQLRNLGIQISVANHGGEALEFLRRTTYCRSDESAQKLSLILMDWEMPVMNGLDCVRVGSLNCSRALDNHAVMILTHAARIFESFKKMEQFRVIYLSLQLQQMLDQSKSKLLWRRAWTM